MPTLASSISQDVDVRAQNHLEAAERHQLIAREFSFNPPGAINPPPIEWVITCVFYSAVHYVTAYFYERDGASPTNHVERSAVMARKSELAPIVDAYNDLSDWSRTARYNALPRLDHRIQPAFDRLDDIAATIKQVLNRQP